MVAGVRFELTTFGLAGPIAFKLLVFPVALQAGFVRSHHLIAAGMIPLIGMILLLLARNTRGRMQDW